MVRYRIKIPSLCPLVGMIIFAALTACHAQNPVRELREKAKPAAHHKRLNALVGEWKVRIQYRIKPGLNPETALGRAEFRWILDGHFLEQVVDGKGIAGSYEGRGLIGYDNVLHHYVGSWIDTMNSGMARSTGKLDPDGRTIHFAVKTTDPLEEKEVQFRGYFKILSPNEIQYLLFAPHPETGDPVPMLNIGYRRK